MSGRSLGQLRERCIDLPAHESPTCPSSCVPGSSLPIKPFGTIGSTMFRPHFSVFCFFETSPRGHHPPGNAPLPIPVLCYHCVGPELRPGSSAAHVDCASCPTTVIVSGNTNIVGPICWLVSILFEFLNRGPRVSSPTPKSLLDGFPWEGGKSFS